MKKIFKKLLAGISVLTVMCMNMLSVSAITFIETDEYKQCIEENFPGFQRFSDEETVEMLEKYSSWAPDDCIDIFYSFNSPVNSPMTKIHLISQCNETQFAVNTVNVNWYNLRFPTDKTNVPTEEEINSFLNENNFDAYVDTYNDFGIILAYDFDITAEVTDDKFRTISEALENEYGFNVFKLKLMSSSTFDISELDDSTLPTTTSETITLAGDLDLDNDTGLADIVILSKYNSNAEIYPISDETARANADVNNDGEINSLDINILIEQLLGGFESAV